MSPLKPLTTHFPLPTLEFTFASFSWPRYVVDLPRGQKSERIKQHKKPVCGLYYHAPKPDQAGKGKGFYFGDRSAPFTLRWQYCDEVAGTRIRHTGWFTDDYQDDKIRGLVFRLPRGRGFLAGWTMGEGMVSAIEGDIYETEIEAARAADELAESTAEDERESFALNMKPKGWNLKNAKKPITWNLPFASLNDPHKTKTPKETKIP